MNLLERATIVAKTFKVKSPRDKVFIVTENFKKEHLKEWGQFSNRNQGSYGRMRFEDTPCYRELKSLQSEASNETKPEQMFELMQIARRRFWNAVTGEITVLATENEADSDLVKLDLPMILQVNGIRRINGEDKRDFANRYL